ncbi:hypothetical protein ACIQXI_21620 [Lysinibacillus sp. NPDC097195]|uniref:hypothetical protein n=1 Tax=Lysinibacillus sp. NPDC097195 TaxID=3364141 RepID=UPI00380FEF28
MIITTHIKAKWVQNKTKTYYEKKGYEFTFFGDEFIVPIEDLPKSSNVLVTVLCDYCGRKLNKEYSNYKSSRDNSPVKKDACNKCHPLKSKEGNKLLYGVEHYTQKPEEAEKIGARNRLSCEFIKEEFKKRNLILLTKTYKNVQQQLEFTCTKHPEKGVMKGSWTNIVNQVGCRYCGFEESSKKQRKDYEEILELFNSKGFILLTSEDEYVNTKTSVKFYCENQPEETLENTADGIRYIQGCRKCFADRNRGENSSHWKGGINTLKSFLRSQINNWKKDSMKAWNYKCVITGKSAEVIHHLHSFSFLMNIVFERLQLDVRPKIGDYKDNEKMLLVEMIEKVHFEYGYGIALTKDMHLLFHRKYGQNTTPDQFDEFKQEMTQF